MANGLIQVKASGMMCSFCTMSVEKALGRVPGVHNVQVNLVHGVILVDADRDRVTDQQGAQEVEELGYTVVVWIGYPILRKTLMAVGQRVINANVLLSTGAWGAFAIGVGHLVAPAAWPNFFPVAVWLMALHLFFGAFKLGTRKRAAESVRRILSLQAQEARVIRDGAEIDVPVADVRPGEVVAIRPGERVPLDGVIRDGASSFDLSAVTGESAPTYREAGGEVVGGTMNLDGYVRVEVTRPASESFVAQVVRLVRQIEERKPPIQLLRDRLMNYYGRSSTASQRSPSSAGCCTQGVCSKRR